MVQDPYRPRPKYIVGPEGSPLTLADLPQPGMVRWVMRWKAEIVSAVSGGLLSLEEACARYRLTADEFLAWRSTIEERGQRGLSLVGMQNHRRRRQAASDN